MRGTQNGPGAKSMPRGGGGEALFAIEESLHVGATRVAIEVGFDGACGAHGVTLHVRGMPFPSYVVSSFCFLRNACSMKPFSVLQESFSSAHTAGV